MRQRIRDLAGRGAGASAAGSGQVTRPAGRVAAARGGTVVHRVVPAQLACRIGARARAGERDAWPAVVSIAVGSFALVFSEVIPVGLLAGISGHLRVPVGTGGLMVVVPAAAAALALAAAAAAAGSLTLLGRAGAAISSPPAGPAGPARERGQEAPAPPGAIDTAGNSGQRAR